MNFSPISDCGRMRQVASLRQSWKSLSVMSRTIAAFLSFVTSSDAIWPTLTPAIFTSMPVIAKPALSKIARTR